MGPGSNSRKPSVGLSGQADAVDAVDAVDAGPKASRVLHRIVQTCANLNTITNAAPSVSSSEEFLNFSFS